jgi:hypothetical protein
VRQQFVQLAVGHFLLIHSKEQPGEPAGDDNLAKDGRPV